MKAVGYLGANRQGPGAYLLILKARLHDRKNWNGSDKKTNGSDKI